MSPPIRDWNTTNPTEGTQRGWRVAEKQTDFVKPGLAKTDELVHQNPRSSFFFLSWFDLTINMTPFVHSNPWVSDTEEDNPLPSPRSRKPLIPRTGNLLIRETRRLWSQISRLRPTGNTVPAIGQACLIIKGKAGVDQGQVGIISDTTASMVWVTYLQDHHGQQVSKLKRPSSLIMLDPGVSVAQDAQGTIWIRPVGTV